MVGHHPITAPGRAGGTRPTQAQNGGEQRITWSIQGDDAVLVRFKKPPQVILRIWLDRPELRSQVSVVVYDDKGEKIIDSPVRPDAKPEWPIKIRREAGIYRVAISLGPPGPAKPIWEATVTLAPPRVNMQARTKT